MSGNKVPVSAARYVLKLLKVNNNKIAKKSKTTKAREKDKHRFGILRILEIF
jgi:hypothetical protein